jgi:hypothetical protein
MDARTENKLFWQKEEEKLDELVKKAMWPGGDKAVERLKKQGKRPVRELILEVHIFQCRRMCSLVKIILEPCFTIWPECLPWVLNRLP